MVGKLITIGHVTEDTSEPENVIGGGVSYSGIAAKELGLDVQIITKLPPGHRFLDYFKQKGIAVLSLPTRSKDITTFTNRYDTFGKRRQVLGGRQEDITLADLQTIPDSILNAACILIAPVIHEVDPALFQRLAKHGLVAVTPQGYFRSVKMDGTIIQKEWQHFEDDLSNVSITILSEEDIKVNGIFKKTMLERIAALSQTVVLTRGENGAIFYEQGKKVFDMKAFPLEDTEERDYTGAGDVFAAAYLSKFLKTKNIHAAAVFAAFIAAIKITAQSGMGIASIPDKKQIEKFKKDYSMLVKKFLQSNHASEDDLTF